MNPALELRNFITQPLILSAASTLGESTIATKLAIQSSIPILFNAVVQKAKSDSLNHLWDLIHHRDNRSNLLNDLDGLFSGFPDEYCGSESLGADFLNTVFDDPENNSQLSKLQQFGLQHNNSSQKIFALIAPLMLCFFKKKIRVEGFGISGFGTWINSYQEEITALLPKGINDHNIESAQSMVFEDKIVPTHHVDNTNWLLWLISIFGLLALMCLLMRSCNTQKIALDNLRMEVNALDSSSVSAKKIDSSLIWKEYLVKSYSALDSNIRLKWLTLGNPISIELPNGSTIQYPTYGMEGKLIHWISDSSTLVDKNSWFDLDRILFETGSSKLNEASKIQIQNIAKILLAFPQVKIKIGGYTDNVGNPMKNLKLSTERAETVSRELQNLAIDSNRMTTEGYGAAFPIGNNSEELGREKNRRISIRVTQK